MKNKNKRFSGSSVRNTVTSFVFGAILFSMLTAYFMPPIYAPSYTSGVNCTDTTLAGCSLQYNGSDELVWANGLVTVNGTLNSDGAIYWDEDSNLPASTYTYIVQNNTNTVINSPSGGAVIFSVAGTNEFTITASGGITATGDSTFGNNDLSSITWVNSTNVRSTNLYPTVVDDVVTLFGHLVPSGTRDAGSQSTGFRDVFVDTILYLKTGLVIKINGGGDPTLATITYSATEPTIAWNTSSSHTGFNLGGVMDLGNYNLINAVTIYDGAASATQTVIEFVSNSSLDIYTYQNGIASALKRISITNGATADIDITNANLDLNGNLINNVGQINVGTINSQSGGDPTIVTLNYPGSWTGVAWNSSWFHTGFVLGGIMDANGQDITDVDSLEGENGQVLTIYGRHSSVGLNTILINTRNAASAETTRLAFTGKQDSSYMIMSAMDFVPSTNNTLLIGNSTKQFSDGYFVNLHLKNAATVGHIVFAGDGLDWTLTEASKLGDSGEGLVLIDGLIGSEYTRIFEVNENGVYYLGDKLASDSRVDQLEQRIAELEQLISELRG